MKKQIKIYDDLKNNFNKKKKEKRENLQKLFLSGKYDIDDNKNKIQYMVKEHSIFYLIKLFPY